MLIVIEYISIRIYGSLRRTSIMTNPILAQPPALYSGADPQALRRALEGEQSDNARRMNLYRFWGITFFFALFVLLGGVLGLRAWQGNLIYFGPYWVATVVVLPGSKFWLRNRKSGVRYLAVPSVGQLTGTQGNLAGGNRSFNVR